MQVARAIAHSALVKTAWPEPTPTGDGSWRRWAIGSPVDPARIKIFNWQQMVAGTASHIHSTKDGLTAPRPPSATFAFNWDVAPARCVSDYRSDGRVCTD